MRPALALLAVAVFAASEKPVGPKAAWAPLMGANAALHDACGDERGDAIGRCLRRFMKKGGVDPSAIAFSKKLDQAGYLRELIPQGKIDLGRVHFPFRANFNDTIYFLNGQPPLIDAYGGGLLGALKLPDDELPFPDGYALPKRLPTFTGIRYVAVVSLRKCRACAQLAIAQVAYDFTDAGKFEGIKLLSVKPSKP